MAISGNFWLSVSMILWSSKGNLGFLWKHCRVKGPPQVCRVEFCSLLEVVVGSLGFRSSCLSTWETARVSSGKSDLHWRSEVHLGIPHTLLQKEIGPHLDLRREPQGSYPFLSLITGSLQSWNRRVRPHLVLRNGTPLASHIVHGMTGHLSSCIWNLWLFPDYASGVSVPLRVVTSFSGLHSKRCPGN